jgi:hypothetical protein
MGNTKRRDITDVDIKLCEELASKGFSRESIAAQMHMSVATFHRKRKENPELEKALDRGYQKDLQEITNDFRERALDGSFNHGKAYLQVRHGIILGDDRKGSGNTQIVVQLPFAAGNANESLGDSDNGVTIEGDFIEH